MTGSSVNDHSDRRLSRRRLLSAGVALPAAALVSSCGGSDPIERPADVPVSPFGADSTAEEVTAGLDLTGAAGLALRAFAQKPGQKPGGEKTRAPEIGKAA